MEFFASKPFEGLEIPDKNEFQRFLVVESEKIPGGTILAYLEEIIHNRPYSSSKEIHKKLNSLDHNLIQDLHNYALRLLSKIYENNDTKSWRDLMKNSNFLEYCIVLGNTNYYKKMNASTNVNKLQIMSELLDITLKYKNSDNVSQITTFNEGKDRSLYVLEYKNKVYFLFPNRHDLGVWTTSKKVHEEEKKTFMCNICDLEHSMKMFHHKVCKCDVCDACIVKHDGNKCPKCKKSIKKDLLKKFQFDILNNFCIGCKLKAPCSIEKQCECRLCQDCIYENPVMCKNCGFDNYLIDKALEDELFKKNVICNFLKDKLAKVTEFEEKLITDVQEIYKIIEKAKNQYLKEIESIKKVISDNIKNLADLTLLKYLSFPKSDLEYSINHSVQLTLNAGFDFKTFESFFDTNFQADFSIEVPVCYKCHQHLFVKPVKLAGCECKICKDCMVRNIKVLPKCPQCSELSDNIEEIEAFCGEKLQITCKSCYQVKNAAFFYKCPKGCSSCFDCLKKYMAPDPQCPVCSFSVDTATLESLKLTIDI